jgi:hypothetical protein
MHSSLSFANIMLKEGKKLASGAEGLVHQKQTQA